MTTRPVFVPDVRSSGLVRASDIEFTWYSGFSASQKYRSRDALHQSASLRGLTPLLEVSSKSQEDLGVALSAFNLRIDVPGVGRISLESAFQGSKVFCNHGDCSDLYHCDPRSAKRTARERDQGDLIRFEFAGESWELEPKTAFYDWLYLRALQESMGEEISILMRFAGFTDIEFNPQKSFNCQARSCALAVSLLRSSQFEQALVSHRDFLNVISGLSARPIDALPTTQASLF